MPRKKKITSPSESLIPLLEALLFAYGEPLKISRLAEIAGAEEKYIAEALGELQKKYESGGLLLLEQQDAYQLGTKPEFGTHIEKLVKSEMHEELSRAAAETLAIVAYKGPLTRMEVEYIRGVNSSFTMRNLMLRGLIERTDNPKDMRSPLYRISFDCLKYLGLDSIEKLPDYAEFRAKLAETMSE